MDDIDIFHNAMPLKSFVDIKKITAFTGDIYDGYQSFNMSVLDRDGRLDCLIRNSSFSVGGIGKDTHLGQESFLCKSTISENILLKPKKLFIDSIQPRTPNEYHGLEDPRYFVWRGNEYALCVMPNTTISGSEVVLLDLSDMSLTKLPDALDRPWNKNWVPYIVDDRLFVVTDIFPTIVYELHDGVWSMVHRTQAEPLPFILHGGSNIFDYKNKKTALVHGRVFIPTESKDAEVKGFFFYWHAFVQWEDGWERVKMGHPFFFENKQIEFSTTAIRHGENILIAYSVNDHGFRLVEFDYEDLEKLL